MKAFLQLVKKAAVDAVEARKPCDIVFGTVKSINPLKIAIENSLEIPEVLITCIGNRNAVEVEPGNAVVLIRKSGGQLYVMLGVIE